MGVYVITGGGAGIGLAAKQQLEAEGHEVFNIDYKHGDFEVVLSTPEGVEAAIQEVKNRYPDGIDCLICNAGVGPTAPPRVIFSLNYYAAIELQRVCAHFLK